MLAYGVPVDYIDKYVQIGESTVIESLKRFVITVVEMFGDGYLRSLNIDDLSKLLIKGEECGIPGILGSINYMQWTWKNCPTA